VNPAKLFLPKMLINQAARQGDEVFRSQDRTTAAAKPAPDVHPREGNTIPDRVLE
jgi:hypothetical protein